MSDNRPYIAIVDYGLGNLFRVKQALAKSGAKVVVTSSPEEVRAASGIVLTGVGAFGQAMDTLYDLKLIDLLREYRASGRPLLGICLGMQLLMSESCEFGSHKGLDIIKGRVSRLRDNAEEESVLKIPHVGWNHIWAPGKSSRQYPDNNMPASWKDTLLEYVPDGSAMYFVHSFYVQPEESGVALSLTRYGDNEFCSSLRVGNVTGVQFHPECSGPNGLSIYRKMIEEVEEEAAHNVK